MSTTTQPPRPRRSIDPREKEEWFRRLPDYARKEFREKWEEEQKATEIPKEVRRQEFRTLVVQVALVLFFGSFLYFATTNLVRVWITLPIPTVLIAWLWVNIPGGRFSRGWIGCAVAQAWHLILMGFSLGGLTGANPSTVLLLVAFFYGALLWLGLFTMLGIPWENRAGSRDRTKTELL